MKKSILLLILTLGLGLAMPATAPAEEATGGETGAAVSTATDSNASLPPPGIVKKKRVDTEIKRLRAMREKDPERFMKVLEDNPRLKKRWGKWMASGGINKIKPTVKELRWFKKQNPRLYKRYLKKHPGVARKIKHAREIKKRKVERGIKRRALRRNGPARGRRLPRRR